MSARAPRAGEEWNARRVEPLYLDATCLFVPAPLPSSEGHTMSVDQFKQFAAYNKWANARLYAAALDLSQSSYRLHIGVAFGGLHGTLNHLLLTDRLVETVDR